MYKMSVLPEEKSFAVHKNCANKSIINHSWDD